MLQHEDALYLYTLQRLLRVFRQMTRANFPIDQQCRRAVRSQQERVPERSRWSDDTGRSGGRNAGTPLRPPRPGDRSMMPVVDGAVLPRKRRRHGSPFVVSKRHGDTETGTTRKTLLDGHQR